MGKIHGGVALKTPTEPANRNYTPTSPSRPSARSVPPAHTGSFERPSASLPARHLAIQFFQHKDFGVHSTKSQRRTQQRPPKAPRFRLLLRLHNRVIGGYFEKRRIRLAAIDIRELNGLLTVARIGS